MRPQQQNRRMRGRNNSGGGGGNNNNNNSNRKGPNPLTRNYESNGPDVKIRGSAQQIAEKYTTLARDAHTSGDRVMSENYLQHAEHYNRIIAAAQAQMPIQQMQSNRDDDGDEGDEEDRFGSFDGMNGNANSESHAPAMQQQPAMAASGSGPQPVIEGMPAEVALNPEAAGQNPPRHRDRRPHVNPAPANQVPQAQAEPGEPVAAAAVGDDQAPRRGRRPRRGGDRNRGDFAADQGGENAAADGDAAPITETSDGAAALAAFDN